MQRRGFLSSILATGFAPAVVGSGILMPVRAIAQPILWLPGDVLSLTLPTGRRLSSIELLNDSGRDLTVDGHEGKVVVRSARMARAVKHADGWHIEQLGLS